MRIEPNSGIETNAAQGKPLGGVSPEEASAALRGGSGTASPAAQLDGAAPATSIGASDAPYVKQALACENINNQAVQEARQLLQSGQLDTPEAARRAAQSMVDLGL